MKTWKQALGVLFTFFLLAFPLAGCAGEAKPETIKDVIPADATVSYLGPQGTYTEQATQCFFGEEASLLPKETVEDAIAALIAGETEFAVIPQENTLGGAVTNYVDALIREEQASVVGEVILPISQTLMGVPGAKLENIKTVYSHAQGLKQSEAWRAEHLPNASAEELGSTAAAASFVAESGDVTLAAVAAPGAAKLYGLEILAENVQITDANKTRFYVLSADGPVKSGHTNAVFVATCEAGRLDDILVEIHNAGLELVTLHDRPEGSKLGAYHYIIEVENRDGIQESQTAKIGGLEDVRFLGCFEVQDASDSQNAQQ